MAQAAQTTTDKPRNKRAQLLEAAAEHFVRHGYAASSMRDIAAGAGMQPASIYYHFPSKVDLLVAVHEEGLRRITQATAGALIGVSGPWTRLEAACIAHLTALLEGGVFFQAVMREPPDVAGEARSRITEMRDEYEAIFVRLLEDIDFPVDTDRHDLRLMLLGAMNWSFTWYRSGQEAPESIARKFVAYLRDGLAAPLSGRD